MSERAPSSLSAKDTELRIPELAGRARLRRVVLSAILLLGMGASYLYFSREPPLQERYRTVRVERRTLIQAVEAAGRIDVQKRIDIPALAEGRLTAIHVVEGEQVKKGQLLAELDPRAAALAVRSAEAAVEAAAGGLAQARAKQAAAQRSLDKAKTLQARGLASPEDVATAEAQLAQADAAYEAARGEHKLAGQNVQSARLGRDLSRIEAPSDGIVLQSPERVGAAVSPERGPLFVLGDTLTTMRVEALVSETEIASIQPGQSAEILITALPNRKFPGAVQRVALDADRHEGAVSYAVRLSVDNQSGLLRPGMTARVRMEVARAQDALSVHEAALRFQPADSDPAPPRTRVWRRTGPADLEPVTVRALISDGVYVQVEATDGSSLQAGDALAVGLFRPESGRSGPQVKLGDKK